MNRIPTLYEVLGVEREASEAEITLAYRRLAQRLHPDKNSSPDAPELFRAVQYAYGILGDEQRRRDYDATLAAPPAVTLTFDDVLTTRRKKP